MKAHTKTVRFAAPARRLFDLVSRPENLPRWATAFCSAVRRDGEFFRASTPGGEEYLRFDADEQSGLIDMWTGPSPTALTRYPTRVIDDGNGGSVFVFTAIQQSGEAEEMFDGKCGALDAELDNIREILASGECRSAA